MANMYICAAILLLIVVQSKEFINSEKEQTQELNFDIISLNRGYIRSNNLGGIQDIKNRDQSNNLKIQELPRNWFWGDVNDTNYLTLVLNQKLPQYCGSSWAFSATSAISDRIKIMRNAQWPDINLSTQVLLSCDQENHGCAGGDDLQAYEYIKKNKIPDQTCSLYQAKDYLQGLQCSQELICGDCNRDEGCWAVDNYHDYTISEFGKLQGEEDIMNEIKERGPVTCSMANTIELEKYTSGILEDKTGTSAQNHVVSIVGWGVDQKTQQNYWYVRNSWGTQWGMEGYFKIIRGVNNLGIEENCHYAVPVDTWSEYDESLKNIQNEPLQLKPDNANTLNKKGVNMKQDPEFDLSNIEKIEMNQHVTSKRSQQYVNQQDLPKQFDWRNVTNVSYMSWNVNQHIPVYCGSCWAQGTASSIADRFNIARKNKFPTETVSVQSIVNCKWGGTCHGGFSGNIYSYSYHFGLPTMTCQMYTANDPDVFACSDIQQCKDCYPSKYGTDICIPAQTEYKRYKVSEYGQLESYNQEQIKAEIYAGGPVSCGIYSTPQFHKYKGGIYSEYSETKNINHIIQLLGWGENDKGEKYWIGRNSWGTYWGMYGYFYITMDQSLNLMLEKECYFGVPIIDQDKNQEQNFSDFHFKSSNLDMEEIEL